jgi:chemotaxis protein methyltransferase CheR
LDDALDYFTDQTGLTFPGGRRSDFEACVARAMARRGIRHQKDLPGRIRADRRLLDELIADLAVHESYFFREPAQFEAIRSLVLPQLLRERGPQALLDIWSAGCAKGEEPYSLAILLAQEGLSARCRIRATDLSPAALANAAQGSFREWSFRGAAAQRARGYFRRRGADFHLDEKIRGQVAFEPLNLVSGPFPSPRPGSAGFDLILCRNVLIYFEPATVARVAGRFYEALAEGGWLITASSDPPLWNHAPFEIQMTPAGVLYRRATVNRRPAPPRPVGAKPCSPPRAASIQIAAEAPVRVRQARVEREPARGVPRGEAPASDPAACLIQIKALANSGGALLAEKAAAAAVARHPLCPDLHYLRAVLLLDLERCEAATAAIRRVLYLDRTLLAPHLLLGSILRRRGDLPGALRAYRNGLHCCANRDRDDIAELTDNEPLARLVAVASREIAALECMVLAT